ncbi:hypothetical protein [Nocardioides sp.]|uniref:hypothetical protein n=1 Tax=Nocardioides sp. TaxID=35761 RepID=UPI003D0DA92E
MNSTARTFLGGAVGVVVLAALGACGGGDSSEDSSGDAASEAFAKKSAKDIQDAALADMKSLDSVTMTGELTQGEGTLGLDLTLNTDGECEGSITIGEGSADLINVGDSSYLKGDEAFWAGTAGAEQGKSVVALLGDKWALIPAEGGFGEVCDLDQLLDGFGDEPTDGEEPVVGDVTEVDGEEAVEVTRDKDGAKVVALVATGDKHYILKIAQEGGDEPGSFTFSDFNEDLDVEAPADDEVVDLAQAG